MTAAAPWVRFVTRATARVPRRQPGDPGIRHSRNKPEVPLCFAAANARMDGLFHSLSGPANPSVPDDPVNPGSPLCFAAGLGPATAPIDVINGSMNDWMDGRKVL